MHVELITGEVVSISSGAYLWEWDVAAGPITPFMSDDMRSWLHQKTADLIPKNRPVFVLVADRGWLGGYLRK